MSQPGISRAPPQWHVVFVPIAAFQQKSRHGLQNKSRFSELCAHTSFACAVTAVAELCLRC